MQYSLFPWFQPIVEIATGRVAGYEVLARRKDEQGRVVSAGALFQDSTLPAAERLQLDRDVRRQALNALSVRAGRYLFDHQPVAGMD